MAPASSRHLAAALIALLVSGCDAKLSAPPPPDGVYRVTTTAKDLAPTDTFGESADNWGTWTLFLDRGRFAFTRENRQVCTWAYGALALADGNMRWTVIDGGGRPADAANQPLDRFAFKWSRFHDVLTLAAPKGAPAGYFAAKPWRRIGAPSPTALSRRCPPPTGALWPTGAERATPSPDASIGFSGALVRTAPETWQGDGLSTELGRGRLTIRGPIVFSAAAVRARLTFTARFPAGELRGCTISFILRRPHGHYLWQARSGQITGASPALHGYAGLSISIGGVTRTNALDHMHGGFRSGPSTERPRRAPPGDLC